MRNIFAGVSDRADENSVWFDLAFDITAARELPEDRRLSIEVRGESDNEVAGFGVELERLGWRRDQFSDDIWFDWGRGAIFSLGAESDYFAEILTSLIGDGLPGRFVDRRECDVVLLNGDPDRIMTDYCRSKFFLGEADDDEAQVFMNFDLPSGLCEFREKDLDYRKNLLQHLVVH